MCSPTSLTDHARASERERATPASTKVSSTCRSGCFNRVITGTAMCVNKIRSPPTSTPQDTLRP
ncbi:Uncharacterised protein [Mycobacterium tuberculosis]|nr:Uncharacterised protein [Mycobacterium tuberculosis]